MTSPAAPWQHSIKMLPADLRELADTLDRQRDGTGHAVSLSADLRETAVDMVLLADQRDGVVPRSSRLLRLLLRRP